MEMRAESLLAGHPSTATAAANLHTTQRNSAQTSLIRPQHRSVEYLEEEEEEEKHYIYANEFINLYTHLFLLSFFLSFFLPICI
jgi:hypothetical protein